MELKLQMKILLRSAVAGLLVLAACTSDGPVNPDETADPPALRPLALSAVPAPASFDADAGGAVAVALSWSPPAGAGIDGYMVVREFMEDGKDTVQGFVGGLDTAGTFVIDTVYESGDTLYDSTWTINVSGDGSGIPLACSDSIGGLFGMLDSTVVYKDPLSGTTNQRYVLLKDGNSYQLRYYVKSWMLLDQDFTGTYSQWLELPLYDTYGYYGQYSEAAVITVTVSGKTVTLSN